MDSSAADEDGSDRDSMDGTRCRRDEVEVRRGDASGCASADTEEAQEAQRGREWLRGARKGRDETAEGTRNGNGCAAWSQDGKGVATRRRLWAVATRRRDTTGVAAGKERGRGVGPGKAAQCGAVRETAMQSNSGSRCKTLAPKNLLQESRELEHPQDEYENN
ncbi:hypothetical protein B0H10DRAFT_1960973 [Mycena sp. CBHHK59/15]|nr:hypothetical protein B0H10DRAFT_1960973 [Mycena sp. CBHHK59/15]